MFLPTTDGPAHTHDGEAEPMISSYLPTKTPGHATRASSCEHHLPGSSQHYCTCKSRATAYSGLRMYHTHSKKMPNRPQTIGIPRSPTLSPAAVPRSPVPRRGGPSVCGRVPPQRYAREPSSRHWRPRGCQIGHGADRSGWHATDGTPSENEVKPPGGPSWGPGSTGRHLLAHDCVVLHSSLDSGVSTQASARHRLVL